MLTASGRLRMKRACSRCRKEHRACEGGLPCRRCVALGSPERCHNNDDDIEQRKKQEGRCSRQAKSLSITAPTKQKPELGRQEQTCPKKPHQSSTPSSSSSSPPPQGSAMALKKKKRKRSSQEGKARTHKKRQSFVGGNANSIRTKDGYRRVNKQRLSGLRGECSCCSA